MTQTTEIPDDIKEMAVSIITGLLREEGWELPETNDEEITTRKLELDLLNAVNKLVEEKIKLSTIKVERPPFIIGGEE